MHRITGGIFYIFLFAVCGFGATMGRSDESQEKELLAQVERLLDENKVSQALQLAQQVLRLNPNNGMAYSLAGACYFRQHRYDEAAPVFEKAVLLQPSNAYAWGDLGVIRMDRYDYEGAESALKEAVNLSGAFSKFCHSFSAAHSGALPSPVG